MDDESVTSASQKGTFLGRTPASWLKIGIFYVAYFAFLTGLFTASIQIMEGQLPADKPKISTRLNIPGINFFPKFDLMLKDQKERIGENDGITFQWEDGEREGKQGYGFYVNITKAVLDTYDGVADGNDFDLETLGDCSPKSSKGNYGWDDGKPCIFFRLNKVIDWVPSGIFKPDEGSMLAEMDNGPTQPIVRDAIYIRCQAVNMEDSEKITGPVFKYFGGDYIGGDGYVTKNFFPYLGNMYQPNYEAPIVAVKIMNLEMDEDFTITCEAQGPSFNNRHRLEGAIQFTYHRKSD